MINTKDKTKRCVIEMIMKTKNILNTIIPITRFNKGEANKIFDEVNSTGAKIVLKNNKPACILISPEEYEGMLETIENYQLLVEAQKRMEKENTTVSHEKVMEQFGITQEEIDNVEVDIE